MRAIEGAERGSALDQVGLPHPKTWAATAAVLGLLAVTVLVSMHPLLAPSHPLLEVTLGHDGVRLGLAAIFGLAALGAARRSLFALMVARPGPIEIIPFTGPAAASRAADEATSELRRSLSELRLRAPSSVPGSGEGEGFLQAVRAIGQATSLYGALAAAIGVLQVPSGYRVAGELRQRPEPPCCGLTIRLYALPAGPTETKTVWASSWAECACQGSYVVGAYVLPRTRWCRRGPWAEWRGRRLRPELFGAYQQAQAYERDRRYEEALEHYEDALRHDPRNTPIRLHVAQVHEKLGLYLSALTGYRDLMVTESAKVDRALWRQLPEHADAHPSHHRHHPRWRGSSARGSRDSLLIARYRFVCALVNGDRVIDEWHDEGPPSVEDPEGINEIRKRERAHSRQRMTPWLQRYYKDLLGVFDAGSPPAQLGSMHKKDRPVFAVLLRYAASREATALAHDYAWGNGRRRPRMPVPQTAVAVLRTWAPVHLSLVQGLEPRADLPLWRQLGRSGPPPNIAAVEDELRTTLHAIPAVSRGWQDYYNAAATLAVPLLERTTGHERPVAPMELSPPRGWDPDDIARRAVWYLELAADLTCGAELEQWLAVDDQDLNGLRGTSRYRDFLERRCPAASRKPRPYDLLTFLASTHHVSLLRDFAHHQAEVLEARRRRTSCVAGTVDLEDLRLARDYSADHADWRTRLRLIHQARPILGGVFPEFAEDPGLRPTTLPEAGASPPDEIRACMKVDRYYRDLVALRRKSWKTISDRLGSLVDRMDRVNATLESSAAVPLAPLAAAVEMWRTLEKLCVASLANEPDKVKERRHHLCETVRRRIDLLDPTAVAASREPTIPDSPTDPARSHRAVGVGRAG